MVTFSMGLCLFCSSMPLTVTQTFRLLHKKSVNGCVCFFFFLFPDANTHGLLMTTRGCLFRFEIVAVVLTCGQAGISLGLNWTGRVGTATFLPGDGKCCSHF